MNREAADLLLEKARTMRADRPVPSPCLSICRMEAGGDLCEGCFRTLDEIAGWGMMTETRKRAVWVLLAQRAALP